MNLPANLLQSIDSWSKDDVHQWFVYCIEEYSLGDIDLNDFQMNGKALLLLNEDGFKERSIRSGDVLYKALQQHHTWIKSLTSQNLSYSFWDQFPYMRHLNFPFFSPFFPQSFHFANVESAIRTRQISTSSSSSIIQPLESKTQSLENPRNVDESVRYYSDRIDFHGEILMKPSAAKNCRILWEFLYILLEDQQYHSVIHWENREKMIFRIVQADKLAALWGLQKNRLSMTYEKLSRGMRYYYSNNIISKEPSKRLLYRFMRSPEEIRKNIKRSTNPIPMISKSDRSSCSSPESETSEKHNEIYLSSKRKSTVSNTRRFEHILNYKKQKLLYAFEQ